MPRYVIERDIPGAGRMSDVELRAISKTSRDVVDAMGPGIQWDHSYVANDRTYCVYIAQNEEQLREHSKRAGFPITRIERIDTMIDPVTAEPKAGATRPLEMAV